MRKVFLGGTCNNSNWREYLIPMLSIPYFNPVVAEWTPDDMEREIYERETCEYVLYVLTPYMQSIYSIAEVVQDSNKRPHRTILCVLPQEEDGSCFDEHTHKALGQICSMVRNNGATILDSLEEVAYYVNQQL